MTKVKKISEKQYVLDCINKQYELCGLERRFDTFEELSKYSKEKPKWFDEDGFFENEAIYKIWIEYCIQHFYDWQPKSVSKRIAKDNVSWFALDYAFPCKKYETTKKEEE